MKLPNLIPNVLPHGLVPLDQEDADCEFFCTLRCESDNSDKDEDYWECMRECRKLCSIEAE